MKKLIIVAVLLGLMCSPALAKEKFTVGAKIDLPNAIVKINEDTGIGIEAGKDLMKNVFWGDWAISEDDSDYYVVLKFTCKSFSLFDLSKNK